MDPRECCCTQTLRSFDCALQLVCTRSFFLGRSTSTQHGHCSGFLVPRKQVWVGRSRRIHQAILMGWPQPQQRHQHLGGRRHLLPATKKERCAAGPAGSERGQCAEAREAAGRRLAPSTGEIARRPLPNIATGRRRSREKAPPTSHAPGAPWGWAPAGDESATGARFREFEQRAFICARHPAQRASVILSVRRRIVATSARLTHPLSATSLIRTDPSP